MARDPELEQIRHDLRLMSTNWRTILAICIGIFLLSFLLVPLFGGVVPVATLSLVMIGGSIWSSVSMGEDQEAFDRAWRRLIERDGKRALKVYAELMVSGGSPYSRPHSQRVVPPEVAEAELAFLDRNAPLYRGSVGPWGRLGLKWRRAFLESGQMLKRIPSRDG